MSDNKTTKPHFPPLGATNYREWAVSMRVWLDSNGCWDFWQSGSTRREPAPLSAEPTAAEYALHDAWDLRHKKASGDILLMLEQDQIAQFVEHMGKPLLLWEALKAHHAKSSAGAQYLAYSTLFQLSQGEDERVDPYYQRCIDAGRVVAALQSTDITVSQLNLELVVMTFLRGARSQFENITSNLLTKEAPTGASARDALKSIEDFNTSTSLSGAQSLRVSTPSTSSSDVLWCLIHNSATHSTKKCVCYEEYSKNPAAFMKQFTEARKAKYDTSRSKDFKSRKAQAAKVEESAQSTVEFAGAASARTSPSITSPSNSWNTDTGASSHMTPRRSWFQEYRPYRVPVRLANGQVIWSRGRGSVIIRPRVGESTLPLVTFTNVLHVPDLAVNLLSVLTLTKDHAYHVHIHGSRMDFSKNKELWFSATVGSSTTGYVDCDTLAEETVASAHAPTQDLQLWHRRLGHIGVDRLNQLVKSDMVRGLEVKGSNIPDPFCESCIAGKHHRTIIPKSVSSRRSLPLELVHSDLHGPTHVRTASGHRYWVVFVDDSTRFRYVFLLKTKAETLDAFKQYKAMAEKQTGYSIKALRDDKGGEYMSTAFEKFLSDNGILREHTTRATPHQNGVAERTNRILDEGVTTLLHDSKLPSSFWGAALSTFIYSLNRSPTSAVDGKTPFESWFRKKPSVSLIRVFGCRVWINIMKDKRKSFQPKAIRAIYIGIPSDFKAWKCYDPASKKIVISRDVTFNESYLPGLSLSKDDPEYAPVLPPGLGLPTPSLSSEPAIRYGDDDDDWFEAEIEQHAPIPAPVIPPIIPPPPPVVPIGQPAPEPHPPSPAPSPSPSPSVSPVPVPTRKSKRRDKNAPPTAPTRVSSRIGKGIITPIESRYKIDSKDRSPHPYLQDRPTSSSPTPGAEDLIVEAKLEESSPTPQRESDSEDSVDLNITGPMDLFEGETASFVQQMDAGELTYSANHLMQYASVVTSTMPRTYKEARNRDDGHLWQAASQAEYDALMRNETWVLEPLPAGRKAIGSRWVYTIKENPDGTIERYKARVVAKGYAQREGIDYGETYAPTANFGSLRATMALACTHDWELVHFDISNAFLNSKTEFEVFMKQPDGFAVKGKEHLVCRLLKTIYGLKQGPHDWYHTLDAVFVKLGFRRAPSDPSVWVWAQNGDRIVIPAWVDDLLVATNSIALREKLSKDLSAQFKMRDMGPVSHILGMEVKRDRPNKILYLSQSKYTKEIIERFPTTGSRSVTTPTDPNIHLHTDQCPEPDTSESREMSKIPYLAAVGSLIYLAIGTRPDISYAVSSVSRFGKNPGMIHWQAVLRIFKYLQHTSNYALQYGPPPPSDEPLLRIYSDASYAQEEKSRSTSGFCSFIGNSLVSWGSKRQTVVATSSAEAEWIAANLAGKEGSWFRKVLREVGFPQDRTPLLIDNESAIAFGLNGVMDGRMKHMRTNYYWLMMAVEEDKSFSLIHVPGIDNTADILTKGLQFNLHNKHVKGLGLIRLDG